MAVVPGYANDDYSNVNAGQEDRIAAQSEATGKIPRSEIEELGGSKNILDNKAGVTTRGVKNDAMKQEREIDQAIERMDAEDTARTT